MIYSFYLEQTEWKAFLVIIFLIFSNLKLEIVSCLSCLSCRKGRGVVCSACRCLLQLGRLGRDWHVLANI